MSAVLDWGDVIQCEAKGKELVCPECGRSNPDVCKRVEDATKPAKKTKEAPAT